MKNLKTFLNKYSRLLVVLALIASFTVLLQIREHVNHPVSGDEPHYLLMDYSLTHDHDLNLKNNYINKDYWVNYPGLITGEFQVGSKQFSTNADKWYSIHTIGLPIALLPATMLDGRHGAMLEMIGIAVGVLVLSWFWVKEIVGSRSIAWLSTALLLGCYFFNGLAGYLYPDIIIAGLTLAALLILHKSYQKPSMQILFGIIVGVLPYMHFKALAAVAPLSLLMLYKFWRYQKKLPWLTAAAAIPLVAYFFLSIHQWFGTWNPVDIYAGFNFFEKVSPPAITSALLFDSMRGLFVYNPVLLLIVVGLPIWYKYKRESFFLAVITVIPSAIALGTFGGWGGGDAPVGRYIMDFLPVLLPALGLALQQAKRYWQQAIVAALATVTVLITIQATVSKREYVRAETRSPLFTHIQDRTGLRLDAVLPTFIAPSTEEITPHGIPKILAGWLILAGLGVYGFALSRAVKPAKQA